VAAGRSEYAEVPTSENAPSEFKMKLPCGQIWVTLTRVLVQVGQRVWGSVVDLQAEVWVQAEVSM
jgi:hypothetical protein